MRYEKPLVVDLSAGARARGQGPLSCITGNGASGSEICATGNGAKSYCAVGNGVQNPIPSCVGGGHCHPTRRLLQRWERQRVLLRGGR